MSNVTNSPMGGAMPTKEIFVVYAQINRTKHYVYRYTMRKADRKVNVEYHTDLNTARPFDSDITAFKFIDSINNMHDRTFLVERVTVLESEFTKIDFTGDGHNISDQDEIC